MVDVKDFNRPTEKITDQEESKFAVNIHRLEKVRSSLNLETKSLIQHKADLDEGLNKLAGFLDAFELTGQDILQNIKKTIPELAEKVTTQAMNSIKAQVAGELKLEMSELQGNITQYSESLRSLQQDIHFAQTMSRKNTILLCLGSVLGSGTAAAGVLLWSWVTVNDQTQTYQKVGKYVHTIIQRQPQEIQKRFWDGLKKLDSLG